MKKLILFLVLSIVVSGSLFAQKNQDKKIEKRVNAYVEAIESKITLSSEEKEKIIALKKQHTEAFFKINKEYKDNAEVKKEKRKEINKKYSRSLNDAFGKERALEIRKAAKKDKKNKKKKKSN